MCILFIQIVQHSCANGQNKNAGFMLVCLLLGDLTFNKRFFIFFTDHVFDLHVYIVFCWCSFPVVPVSVTHNVD